VAALRRPRTEARPRRTDDEKGIDCARPVTEGWAKALFAPCPPCQPRIHGGHTISPRVRAGRWLCPPYDLSPQAAGLSGEWFLVANRALQDSGWLHFSIYRRRSEGKRLERRRILHIVSCNMERKDSASLHENFPRTALRKRGEVYARLKAYDMIRTSKSLN